MWAKKKASKVSEILHCLSDNELFHSPLKPLVDP